MAAYCNERGQLFRRFHLQNHQNVNEIDSAGDNLSVESDSQANQRNQTEFFPCNNDIEAKSSFIGTNEENKR